MRTDHRFAHARARAGPAPECLHTLSGTILRSRYPGARGLAGKGSYCSRVLPYGAQVCPGACGVKSARVFPYGGTPKKTSNTNRSNTDHLRNASSARRFACGSPGGRLGNSQDHLRGSAASRDPFCCTKPLFLLCENVQNDTLNWRPGRSRRAWGGPRILVVPWGGSAEPPGRSGAAHVLQERSSHMSHPPHQIRLKDLTR